MSTLPYTIKELRTACEQRRIIWREHAADRMLERGILRSEVIRGIMRGEIIEEYPEDYPIPSCLVLGFVKAGKPIHVVCSMEDNYIYIITAYEPNIFKWENDFKTRRNTL